jgi:glycosyltransferase involved in cell wall biosynthesis
MSTDRFAPRYSLVIPAYNEERYLPDLLDSVDVARARYSGGAQAIEVVVADNASTDRTAAIAASRGCIVVPESRRCIAAARNAGARAARGDVLAFVDADSRIHAQTFDLIDRALETGWIVGGATGVTFDRWSVGRALTFAAMMPVVWLTGMDTGVVFCRGADFTAVGGYDEKRRIAEDVAFLLALRRLGRGRGQRLGRVRRAKAVTSARKFEEHGEWHWVTMMATLPLALLLRTRGAHEFVERYWYRPSR